MGVSKITYLLASLITNIFIEFLISLVFSLVVKKLILTRIDLILLFLVNFVLSINLITFGMLISKLFIKCYKALIAGIALLLVL